MIRRALLCMGAGAVIAHAIGWYVVGDWDPGDWPTSIRLVATFVAAPLLALALFLPLPRP